LHEAIDHGLPEDVALAALTKNAAATIGAVVENQGVIEPGRWANLTLLEKPLKDKEAKVVRVFVEGKRFEIDEGGGGPGGPGFKGRGRRRGMRGDDRESKDPEEKPAESQPTT